ncbi:MAG: ribosome assembly factor SBDS [Candidatus Jordarchaeum sp.]|uniref:ribosome assembly factor SBDS n=1 Tax=Candidatus Jordarchaeum sp. TaxID=2823881 RepID=UPI00404B5C6A
MSDIRGSKWVDLGDTVIARLEFHGEKFEILVDPDKAWDFRRGKDVDLSEILKSFNIFEDAHKGLKATEDKLLEIFETNNVDEIARIILKKGFIQLTTEQRREIINNKKLQIINILARNCINPQTGLPHPPTRIERAMDEAKVSIDLWRSPEEQAKDVLKMIQPIIPIRMELLKLAVKFPPEFSGKGYGLLERFGTVSKDEWQKDGSWIAVVEIPAGIRGKFVETLNNQTRGKAQVKIMKE